MVTLVAARRVQETLLDTTSCCRFGFERMVTSPRQWKLLGYGPKSSSWSLFKKCLPSPVFVNGWCKDTSKIWGLNQIIMPQLALLDKKTMAQIFCDCRTPPNSWQLIRVSAGICDKVYIFHHSLWNRFSNATEMWQNADINIKPPQIFRNFGRTLLNILDRSKFGRLKNRTCYYQFAPCFPTIDSKNCITTGKK